jgi:hypothetical protein
VMRAERDAGGTRPPMSCRRFANSIGGEHASTRSMGRWAERCADSGGLRRDQRDLAGQNGVVGGIDLRATLLREPKLRHQRSRSNCVRWEVEGTESDRGGGEAFELLNVLKGRAPELNSATIPHGPRPEKGVSQSKRSSTPRTDRVREQNVSVV